jgi:hypothetical protein
LCRSVSTSPVLLLLIGLAHRHSSVARKGSIIEIHPN